VKLDGVFAVARSENNELLAIEIGSKMRAICVFKKDDLVSWIKIDYDNSKSSSTLID